MEGHLKAGEIIHLNWSPQSGSEMASNHFGVVLSVEAFNKLIPRVIVAPITSKDHPAFGYLRIPLQTVHGKYKGYICLDHIRSLDPDARGAKESGDEATLACKNQYKDVLRKIFGL